MKTRELKIKHYLTQLQPVSHSAFNADPASLNRIPTGRSRYALVELARLLARHAARDLLACQTGENRDR